MRHCLGGGGEANFQHLNFVAIRDQNLISTFKHFRLALLPTLSFVVTGRRFPSTEFEHRFSSGAFVVFPPPSALLGPHYNDGVTFLCTLPELSGRAVTREEGGTRL